MLRETKALAPWGKSQGSCRTSPAQVPLWEWPRMKTNRQPRVVPVWVGPYRAGDTLQHHQGGRMAPNWAKPGSCTPGAALHCCPSITCRWNSYTLIPNQLFWGARATPGQMWPPARPHLPFVMSHCTQLRLPSRGNPKMQVGLQSHELWN